LVSKGCTAIVTRKVVCDNPSDHRMKATLGITGLSRLIVHIDNAVWHLDVDSPYPGGVSAPKGLVVRQLKGYVS